MIAVEQERRYFARGIDLVGVANDPRAHTGVREPWYSDSWQYRFRVTALNAYVREAVSALLYDLSDAPDGFWDHVKAAGADIRVTSADKTTEIPRELCSFDATARTGALFFPGSSINIRGYGTDFYIYYGNPSAETPAAASTYGSQAVWTDYKSVYHLEGDAADSTANANNGTLTGGPVAVAGLVPGLALSFDGVDDFIDIPLGAVLAAASGCTLQAVLKVGTFADRRFFSRFYGDNDNARSGSISITPGGAVTFFVENAATAEGRLTITSASTYAVGQKLYIFATWDHTTTQVRLYVNKVLEAVGILAGPSRQVGSNKPALMSSVTASPVYTHGELDECRSRQAAIPIGQVITETNNLESPSTFFETDVEWTRAGAV